MNYKLVLFDFDGTLADSALWFLNALNSLSTEFGFRPIAEDERDLVRGFDTRQFLKHLGIPFWKVAKMALRLRQMAARECSQMRLFPGVHELLANLEAAGVVIGIVSSNSAETIRTVLGPESAARVAYFSCGASILGKASHLQRVLRLAKVQAAEAIYIGDEIRDAIAAREVGMPFGAVAWGYATSPALLAQNPAQWFSALPEILDCIVSGKGLRAVPAGA